MTIMSDWSMSRISSLFASICILGLIQSAVGESVDLGPVSISVDLDGLSVLDVVREEEASMEHDRPRFEYTLYPAAITLKGHRILIEVHQMSAPMPLDDAISEREEATGIEHCIMESGMLPRGAETSVESYTIDGQDGLLLRSDGGDLYIAGWSPDQVDDGSGTIVCVVGSDLPWETTERIFRSLTAEV